MIQYKRKEKAICPYRRTRLSDVQRRCAKKHKKILEYKPSFSYSQQDIERVSGKEIKHEAKERYPAVNTGRTYNGSSSDSVSLFDSG